MATNAATSASGRRLTTTADKKRQEAVTGFLFMLPSLLILGLFLILPLLVALYFSFTDWNGVRPLNQPEAYDMVGLRNYERLLVSGRRVDDFYTALKNTIYYVIGVVPLQTMLALLLAVIVNQRWLRGRGFFRTAFYFPSVTSSVVVSMIFIYMFTKGGFVNQLFGAIFPNYQSVNWLENADGLIHLLLGSLGVTRNNIGAWAMTEVGGLSIWDWFSGPSVTMFMIMMLAVWTTIGTMMVIYLAALQNVSREVYEAAEVDGTTGWQAFRFITLPLLRPTTFFIITIGLIGAFQVFDQVYVISKGEPENTTMTIAYLVYESAFDPQRANMGLASATAIVLFVIIFVFTLVQRRLTGGDRANV